VETVRVYALGASSDADIPLPEPLLEPDWLLVEPVQYPEALVDEDSDYPDQRLWRRDATREYRWAGTGDPSANAALVAAKFADASVSF
jgi:hypothetical protein